MAGALTGRAILSSELFCFGLVGPPSQWQARTLAADATAIRACCSRLPSASASRPRRALWARRLCLGIRAVPLFYFGLGPVFPGPRVLPAGAGVAILQATVAGPALRAPSASQSAQASTSTSGLRGFPSRAHLRAVDCSCPSRSERPTSTFALLGPCAAHPCLRARRRTINHRHVTPAAPKAASAWGLAMDSLAALPGNLEVQQTGANEAPQPHALEEALFMLDRPVAQLERG